MALRTWMSSNGSTAVLKSMLTKLRSAAKSTSVFSVSAHWPSWSSEMLTAMSMSPDLRASRRVVSSGMNSIFTVFTGALPPQ